MASDLDLAVGEFGRWVESGVDEAIREEYDSAGRGEKIPRDRLREVADVVVSLRVRQEVVDYTEIGGGGRAVLRMPATGDPKLDADWGRDDVTTTYLDDEPDSQ